MRKCMCVVPRNRKITSSTLPRYILQFQVSTPLKKQVTSPIVSLPPTLHITSCNQLQSNGDNQFVFMMWYTKKDDDEPCFNSYEKCLPSCLGQSLFTPNVPPLAFIYFQHFHLNLLAPWIASPSWRQFHPIPTEWGLFFIFLARKKHLMALIHQYFFLCF